MILRYICAVVWLGILCCFSYGELLIHVITKSDIPFEAKFIELNSDTGMILTNVGLIGMLYVDNIITKLITKSQKEGHALGICLTLSIIIAIFVTIISQKVINKVFIPEDWFKISYLFYIFITCLVIYKAESLKIAHVSDDNAILPSKR